MCFHDGNILRIDEHKIINMSFEFIIKYNDFKIVDTVLFCRVIELLVSVKYEGVSKVLEITQK